MDKNILKFDVKNFSFFTILSILFLLAGLLMLISWRLTYGFWYDIGIYALTIVFIIPGIVGILWSLMFEKEEED